MSHQRRYRSMAPIGEAETGLRSPAPTASADYAALRALSSGGRPELGFEAERVAEGAGPGSNVLCVAFDMRGPESARGRGLPVAWGATVSG